ncbi:hypothetical protein BDU57DRAFT_515246 [Ampelomyces quisqualis]|uniref:Uncharacterized protein n=1 Tax=Ampelomyces quisqualis TaxID=50730 RepID=A0A6A5QUI1_AMPQU|nr:hypothetical protein BDU57DRAFT_515246 [Ampelomyces quisqualis]
MFLQSCRRTVSVGNAATDADDSLNMGTLTIRDQQQPCRHTHLPSVRTTPRLPEIRLSKVLVHHGTSSLATAQSNVASSMQHTLRSNIGGKYPFYPIGDSKNCLDIPTRAIPETRTKRAVRNWPADLSRLVCRVRGTPLENKYQEASTLPKRLRS